MFRSNAIFCLPLFLKWNLAFSLFSCHTFFKKWNLLSLVSHIKNSLHILYSYETFSLSFLCIWEPETVNILPSLNHSFTHLPHGIDTIRSENWYWRPALERCNHIDYLHVCEVVQMKVQTLHLRHKRACKRRQTIRQSIKSVVVLYRYIMQVCYLYYVAELYQKSEVG